MGLQFKMRNDETCKVACRIKINAESAKKFKEKIDDDYRVNMYRCLFQCNSFIHSYFCLLNPSLFRILDNLPVAVQRQRRDGNQLVYEHGFRVGYKTSYDTGVSCN